MNKGRKELEMLLEKILNLIENEGYEVEESKLSVLHNSNSEAMGSSGGRSIGEIKITVIKKYGMSKN